MEDFDADRAMQHLAASTLHAVNSTFHKVDASTADAARVAMWDEVQRIRNKMAHEFGSVSGEDYYHTLTQVLPQIETALRKHVARSVFDCAELHRKIGTPSYNRDVGTDRETRGRK